MKKIIFTLLMLLIFTGCGREPEKAETLAFDNSSFVVTKDGLVKDFSNNDKIVKIEWYTDPLCPDCARAHTQTHDFINKQVEEGKLEVKYHTLNFLPKYSKTNYPLRASSWIMGVVNFSPDNIHEFMNLIMDENQTTEPDKRDDEYIKSIALKSGVSNENIKKIENSMDLLKNSVNKASENIRENKELLKRSNSGKMFVPFIFISDKEECALDGENEDTKCNIQDPIEKMIKELEIKPCDESKPCED